MSEQEHAFFFDEFFETEENKTVTLPVVIAGRTVPLTIKRGLTNADRTAAEMAAIRRQVLPNGQVKLVGMDEERLTNELVVRGIVRWPFRDRATGEMVPVTVENLKRLRGGAEAIMLALTKFDQEGDAALATFPGHAAPPAADEAQEGEHAEHPAR